MDDAVQLDLFGTREMQVHDLKYGRVPVEARDNKQLLLYALGALERFGSHVDQVRLVIHQPRLNHVSEWVVSVSELLAFGREAKRAAQRAMYCLEIDFDPQTDLVPGEAQCKWCKAKSTCPALREHVLATVADDFVDLDKPIEPQLAPAMRRIESSDNAHLANCLAAVDLIEGWCKAVRAKVERELLTGNPVRGFKLVAGKRGLRRWADPSEVEAIAQTWGTGDRFFERSLISPAAAERLAKSESIDAAHWQALQPLITQSDPRPTVAPESDKRPSIQPPDAVHFDALP